MGNFLGHIRIVFLSDLSMLVSFPYNVNFDIMWNPQSCKREGGEVEKNHLEETKSQEENEPKDQKKNWSKF